ncbi:nucleoside monophosphate kinase [Lacunisphaera limnophila]|uniref:nucleoside monophosphate kinase n=1 Tax=Lacunisphaera limnophila TaxID=1838286 RepID=UPI002150033A|nr:nucleoside monophosphate kinase [Lacunisphaera limnophila]
MIGAEHSSAFSALAPARAKFLLLGPSAPLPAGLVLPGRSLNLEHVSPALLVQQEISRRTPLGQQAGSALSHGSAVPERIHLALLRKWFWARKPDAGFLLEGFPATLLQALVFDEWLEARDETLTACLVAPAAPADIVTHYRTQGLLCEALHAAA